MVLLWCMTLVFFVLTFGNLVRVGSEIAVRLLETWRLFCPSFPFNFFIFFPLFHVGFSIHPDRFSWLGRSFLDGKYVHSSLCGILQISGPP